MSDCAGQHLVHKSMQFKEDLGRHSSLVFCKSIIQPNTWAHSQLESAGKMRLVIQAWHDHMFTGMMAALCGF